MNTTKQNKLEKNGWRVGSASDFLELTEAEEMIIGMRLALASQLMALRHEQNVTQQQVARKIGSSQSRVAKMESADPSVSLELLIRSLVSLGLSSEQVGRAISSSNRASDKSRKKSPRGGDETKVPG